MQRRKEANEWDLNNLKLSEEFDLDIDFFSGDPDGASSSLDLALSKKTAQSNFAVDFSDGPNINDIFGPIRKRKFLEVKTASELNQILKKNGFLRIANSSTLINKSTRDLWALKKDKKGNFIIEQLFEEEEEPLKDTF